MGDAAASKAIDVEGRAGADAVLRLYARVLDRRVRHLAFPDADAIVARRVASFAPFAADGDPGAVGRASSEAVGFTREGHRLCGAAAEAIRAYVGGKEYGGGRGLLLAAAVKLDARDAARLAADPACEARLLRDRRLRDRALAALVEDEDKGHAGGGAGPALRALSERCGAVDGLVVAAAEGTLRELRRGLGSTASCLGAVLLDAATLRALFYLVAADRGASPGREAARRELAGVLEAIATAVGAAVRGRVVGVLEQLLAAVEEVWAREALTADRTPTAAEAEAFAGAYNETMRLWWAHVVAALEEVVGLQKQFWEPLPLQDRTV